ncbi:PvuII DNA methyltransferase [Sphaerospermopsis reniformis]|jgi:DNA modification methylase|uniref:PvuII DNA methyltransferase n=1 Tax=Sphaerospermopsis reniformis TaxID=531300 RepID=A0A480A2T7_9CYAN|nr:PvuII DNA methyltransferase [Sphaerospermopsis reniformis]
MDTRYQGNNQRITKPKGNLAEFAINCQFGFGSADLLFVCKPAVIKINPVGYPQSFAEFFIKLLTDEGDLFLDPFAFSKRTGFVDMTQQHHWVSLELNEVDGRENLLLTWLRINF